MTFPLPALGFGSSPLSEAWEAAVLVLCRCLCLRRVWALKLWHWLFCSTAKAQRRRCIIKHWPLILGCRLLPTEKKEKYPRFKKKIKITLSHAFGWIYALWDTYQQTFPVLYRWVFFRVSCLRAWWGVGFARGIFLCGMLKETEQILNLKVMFKSEAIRVRSLLCVLSSQKHNKSSGMACNSLLCLNW